MTVHPPACVECGNDDARHGSTLCGDCMERPPADGPGGQLVPDLARRYCPDCAPGYDATADAREGLTPL